MGYSKYVMGTDEARQLTRHCVETLEWEPGAPVAVAIEDDRGELVSCLRMVSAKAFQLEPAICKAFTASTGELNSSSFGDRDRGRGTELACYPEKRLTHVAGGIPIAITDEDTGESRVIGGIGISGRSPADDKRIAALCAESRNG